MNSSLKYLPKNNATYNFDPRLKIIALLFYVVLVWIPTGFTGLLFLLIPIVFAWVNSRLGIKKFIKVTIYVMLFSSIFLIINLFLVYPPEGEIWTPINPDASVVIYKESIVKSFDTFLRIYTLMLASTIYALTTKPSDISRGVKAILYPFEKVGLNTDSISLIIMVAIRYVPTLVDELKIISNAYELKGGNAKYGNVSNKVSLAKNSIVPAFLITFNYAENLSTSLEARGYSPSSKKTNFVKLNLDIFDLLISIFLLAIFTIVIILGIDTSANLIPKFADNLI